MLFIIFFPMLDVKDLMCGDTDVKVAWPATPEHAPMDQTDY